MMSKKQGRSVKNALGGMVLFYLLIVFEIAYMAGPFAIYFYGVYNPILKFFNQSPILSVLNSFFLPHIARETSSTLINIHDYIGLFLAGFGFMAFCIGACQIYYSKFARKGAVTGGIYNFVRHPQYTSFAICGFGLLVMWPRFINLLMYVTMLFVYNLLARMEERECEEKFGQIYIDYKNKTARFLPLKFHFKKELPIFIKLKRKKVPVLICMYILAMGAAFGAAKGIYAYSINCIYAIYTEDSVTVSLSEIKTDKLEQIMNIAVADKKIKSMLNETGEEKFLNYVLPTEWFSAEIPMNGVKYRAGHQSSSDYDDTQYKIIFTKADIRRDAEVSGKEILSNVLEREPIVEVWVDLDENTVVQILEIPDDYKYQGIPVAVY